MFNENSKKDDKLRNHLILKYERSFRKIFKKEIVVNSFTNTERYAKQGYK